MFRRVRRALRDHQQTRRRSGTLGWTVRQWCVLGVFVVTALVVAVGVITTRGDTVDPRVRTLAHHLLGTIESIPVRATREHRGDYERSAFGTAWTDDVRVPGGGNGCDTRNDILNRDLRDTRTGLAKTCAGAVLAGELHSPYTGEFIVFRRDRGAAAVQIDHIVPLAYAWDMGAWGWPPELRRDFANDPANLVAVDGKSNQDKSDGEPARWMPPARGFWCQYAVQFVIVVRSYRLAVDAASRRVLSDALRC
ncbi:Domain of unknown function DUF1994 [Gordonia bronchialis DSM 43247]|uniref:GmrSD restriction endonucleases C-terminal domain-containing protein n=1 Tax=Gordonia bronchialis (strain ATCC 25592 / DSM 43247 / BCRC 13721 / JCM 3198 / KCTC 3076 / NBRC 16047 / NCTC 10667) TaxID=526226 RepID=D0LC17_GORB4|nr:HNH endonuclease family protein [Gordonia bronchialis]ACY22404.1 Domain of unknown function DUF1994 [Gordonia bronchialis DSM 43247]MCC3325191.1 HNH endonuclease family protein [Gordonia bronchialis]STQ65332.1 Domain of uncharacterised function (DUF1994) [Gordonia bronchialis]